MPKVLSDAEIVDFRERLCDEAERMFAENRPEEVTMRRLAAALGVSPMTPYRYFDDKDAILAAVRARAFNNFADALQESFKAGASPMRGRKLADAYATFALEHPQAYKLMFDVSQPTGKTYPDLVQAWARAYELLVGPITDDSQTWSFDNPGMIASMFWAAMHGAVMLAFAGNLRRDLEPAKLVALMLDALTFGITTNPDHFGLKLDRPPSAVARPTVASS